MLICGFLSPYFSPKTRLALFLTSGLRSAFVFRINRSSHSALLGAISTLIRLASLRNPGSFIMSVSAFRKIATRS